MKAIEQISEKGRKLHQDSIIIDATSFFVEGYSEVIQESGATALGITTPMPWEEFESSVSATENYYKLIADTPELCLIECVQDLYDAKAAGQVGIILFAQSPSAIGNRLSRVETMARLGYRIIQLTYSDRNYVGDGCNEETDVGLSRFGQDLVKEMNRHGIVVDLAHAGQQTALEGAQISEKPVIVSHTNPRALYPSNRNLIDEVIDAVAAGGGVIGASPFGLLNWDGQSQELPTMDHYMRAIDYLADRVGVDHIGIGTDSEAAEGAYPTAVTAELRRRYGQLGSAYRSALGNIKEKHVSPFRGMRDMPLITEALLNRGYSDEDVRKILGLNFIRVYEAVWPS